MVENEDVIRGEPHYHLWVDGKKACGERDGSWPQKYMSNSMALKVKPCPVCSELGEVPTLAPQEPKLDKREEQPTTTKQGLYLRQYLRGKI